MQYLHKY